MTISRFVSLSLSLPSFFPLKKTEENTKKPKGGENFTYKIKECSHQAGANPQCAAGVNPEAAEPR